MKTYRGAVQALLGLTGQDTPLLVLSGILGMLLHDLADPSNAGPAAHARALQALGFSFLPMTAGGPGNGAVQPPTPGTAAAPLRTARGIP